MIVKLILLVFATLVAIGAMYQEFTGSISDEHFWIMMCFVLISCVYVRQDVPIYITIEEK